MNKNILRLLPVFFITAFSSIKGSDHHLAFIDKSSNETHDALSRAKNTEYNDFIIDGKIPSLAEEFRIALCAGRYDYLGTMPNKKNWLTNMFKSKKTQYVNDLINEEINPVTQDSPLHLAVKIAGYHRSQALKALRKKDIKQENESIKKLNQMNKTILFLIENGANVNAENSKGETPLHLAYKVTEYQSAYILLEAFSNPMAEDKDGKTPFQHLDKETTKNEAEYQNFRKDYYDAYYANNERILKNTNETLSKIKIIEKKSINNLDYNNPIKTNLDLSQMKSEDNHNQNSGRTSSEKTLSDRSSQLSKKPQRTVSQAQIKAAGNKNNNIEAWSNISAVRSKPQSKKSRKTKETASKVSAYYVKESRSKVYTEI